MPFLNRMGTVFWICVLVQVTISPIGSRGQRNPKAFMVDRHWFRTNPSFRVGAVAVCALLALVYVIFW